MLGVAPHYGDMPRRRELPGIARALDRGKAYGITSRIEAESLFVACHRFKVFHGEVFGPVARRLDGEIRITVRINARVTPHRSFVSAFLFSRNTSIEGDDLNSGIATVQIEA